MPFDPWTAATLTVSAAALLQPYLRFPARTRFTGITLSTQGRDDARKFTLTTSARNVSGRGTFLKARPYLIVDLDVKGMGGKRSVQTVHLGVDATSIDLPPGTSFPLPAHSNPIQLQASFTWGQLKAKHFRLFVGQDPRIRLIRLQWDLERHEVEQTWATEYPLEVDALNPKTLSEIFGDPLPEPVEIGDHDDTAEHIIPGNTVTRVRRRRFDLD